jgi:hypothetical protein
MAGLFRRFAMVRLRIFLLTIFWFGLINVVTASDFPKAAFTTTTSDGNVWVLKFNNDGKFDVTQNGEDAVEGKYKVSKSQIEFVDETGPLAQPDAKTGTYEWEYQDEKLTFDKISDNAEGRSQTLTSGPWDKKEK